MTRESSQFHFHVQDVVQMNHLSYQHNGGMTSVTAGLIIYVILCMWKFPVFFFLLPAALSFNLNTMYCQSSHLNWQSSRYLPTLYLQYLTLCIEANIP